MDADGVVANRIDVGDVDILLTHLKDLLAGAVSLYLGGRGEDPQVLRWITVLAAVVEADLQYA
jgi:hypothetical protein